MAFANLANQCQFIGNLGRDPEMRYLASGRAVTNFSIAVTKWIPGKDGAEGREETTWIRVTSWGPQAETVNKLLKKGDKVIVTTEFSLQKGKTEDGEEREYPTFTLQDFKKLSGKSGSGQSKPSKDDDDEEYAF